MLLRPSPSVGARPVCKSTVVCWARRRCMAPARVRPLVACGTSGRQAFGGLPRSDLGSTVWCLLPADFDQLACVSMPLVGICWPGASRCPCARSAHVEGAPAAAPLTGSSGRRARRCASLPVPGESAVFHRSHPRHSPSCAQKELTGVALHLRHRNRCVPRMLSQRAPEVGWRGCCCSRCRRASSGRPPALYIRGAAAQSLSSTDAA
jgi:hypothetical protein